MENIKVEIYMPFESGSKELRLFVDKQKGVISNGIINLFQTIKTSEAIHDKGFNVEELIEFSNTPDDNPIPV